MANIPHILYVEDNLASRQVMSLIVETVMHYQLTMLEHSQDIMQQLAILNLDSENATPFDVIILDLNMKPLDGIEVCALLRNDIRFQKARIVVLTATATPSEIRRMQECGFDGMLNKPIDHMTFPRYIERIIYGEAIWDE